MSFKQPHEGITGTDQSGNDLLSLEESAIAVRKMMAGLFGVLHRATLVGNPAPVVQRIHERMRDPQPGDLVMETSTSYRQSEHWYKGFGILLDHRVEWWETDAERDQLVAQERAAHEDFLRSDHARPGAADVPWTPDERGTDHAWYIQYGPDPADICRWVDCEFMAIPTDPREAEH